MMRITSQLAVLAVAATTGLALTAVPAAASPVRPARAASALVLALGAAVPRSAGAGTHVVAGGRAAASGGTWGNAEEVPGTAALNTGGSAEVNSVSCASAGNCSAGGSYMTAPTGQRAFAVSETNGVWGTAKEVAGSLGMGRSAAVQSVSCASAGNCSAGGSYVDSTGHFQAFVVDEKNGTWGTAKEVAAALNTGGEALIYSVSCASAGNCSAGGSYTSSTRLSQAFVVNETNGTWGKAKEVAAALNAGGNAGIVSLSCASAGNCSAGGRYDNGTHRQQAFVVNETHGTWGKAEEVPGSGALNQAGDAGVISVSCASAGNCSAGGSYADVPGSTEAFVVDETNGTWGTAQEVAGSLNQGGLAVVESVSCASAASCSAGGYYYDANSNQQAFIITKS